MLKKFKEIYKSSTEEKEKLTDQEIWKKFEKTYNCTTKKTNKGNGKCKSTHRMNEGGKEVVHSTTSEEIIEIQTTNETEENTNETGRRSTNETGGKSTNQTAAEPTNETGGESTNEIPAETTSQTGGGITNATEEDIITTQTTEENMYPPKLKKQKIKKKTTGKYHQKLQMKKTL